MYLDVLVLIPTFFLQKKIVRSLFCVEKQETGLIEHLFSYLGVQDIVSTFFIVKIYRWFQEIVFQVTTKQSYSVLKENFDCGPKNFECVCCVCLGGYSFNCEKSRIVAKSKTLA